jgi:hypothetical protein
MIIIDLYFRVAYGGSDNNKLKKAENISFKSGFFLHINFKPVNRLGLIKIRNIEIPGTSVNMPDNT